MLNLNKQKCRLFVLELSSFQLVVKLSRSTRNVQATLARILFFNMARKTVLKLWISNKRIREPLRCIEI